MLKPINIEDIPDGNGKYSYIESDIAAFIASGELAAEIDIPPDSYAGRIHSSYTYAVKKKSFPVQVIKRDKRVFLVKKEANNA